MNRKEYMRQLERELKLLPKKEREEALLYYEEYFEDSGEEKEAQAIEELGNPKNAASQILKELAIKRLDKPKKAGKKGLSTLWIVLLAMCAAPVGLPLLLAGLVTCLAMLFSIGAVVLCVILCGVLFLGISVVSIVAGIYFLPTEPVHAITILGAALLEMGGGLVVVLGGILCCTVLFAVLGKCVKRILTGGKRHEENH